MPNWVIQRIDTIAVSDRRDISDNNEPMFMDQFDNDIDFSSALHEGGITGVVQGVNKQDYANRNDDSNTDE